MLEELAEARSLANNTTKEGEIKQIIQSEKQRQSWRKIGIVNKKNKSGKVIKLWVHKTITDPNGNTTQQRYECSTKEEMEKAIIEENETRFTRCTASAFFSWLLLGIFGVMFDGPGFWEVLKGTWQTPQHADMDPYAADILTEARDNHIPPEFCTRPSHITKEENSRCWKKRRAGTASESTELNFTHHIVAAYSPEMSEVDAALRSAPYELGFAATAFREMTDFQLLKVALLYVVAKMRSLKLMVAAFNENNKKLARDMMCHAEAADMIAPEQGGGRKRHTSSRTATEVVLNFDLARQQRRACAHVGLDASQCYDRVVHTPAAICMVQHGAHEPAVRSMFGVIQQANNKVATAYGVSEASYGGQQRADQGLHPVQSLGQGNGAGPGSFLTESSNGISNMRKRGFGALTRACLSLMTLFMVCFMWVDDQQYNQMAKTVLEAGELLVQITKAGLAYWVGFLQATGGAINPDKSYWYLLDYKWTGSRWAYRTMEDMEGQLQAPNPDGQILTLTRLEAHQSSRQLGVYTAPDGNMVDQIAHLKAKATDFAKNLKANGLLSRNEVWLNTTHTIRKTMEYPMPAITVPRQDWDDIAKVIHTTALPRAGIVRTFPHAVLYGPSKYQGLGGYTDYWHDQELTHLMDFIKQVHSQTICGKRYQMAVEQLRLETGWPGPITQVPYETFQALTTDSWIKTLWSSCQQFGITIQDNFGTLKPLRQDDILLMPLFHARYGHNKDFLQKLGFCRMYLEANSLADLCLAKGDRLHPSIYEGNSKCPNWRAIEWPRPTPRPGADYWNAWKQAMNECFLQFASTDLKLQRPLGQWLVDPIIHSEWLFSPATGTLIHKADTTLTKWTTRRPNRQGVGGLLYSEAAQLNDTPDDCVPASISRPQRDKVKLLSYSIHPWQEAGGAVPQVCHTLSAQIAELP